MNVLLFVMSMLMLMALITYGRIESFRSFAFVQARFKNYMEHTERDYLNEEAIKRYQNTAATRIEKSDQVKREKNPASSTLSFRLFVDKEERQAHQDKLEEVTNMAKHLMLFLYGDQPFYKEMEAKRPNFLNEIFAALIHETDQLPKNKKLKKAKEIATIDLKDPELNDVFTRMLKGAYEDPMTEAVEKRPLKPERGYYSLIDFLTVDKDKLKVRVFLASRQLLMALYGNPALVNEIVSVRSRLYQAVVNKEMSAEAAGQEFTSLYSGRNLPYVQSSMLDFGVSKTNPKDYE